MLASATPSVESRVNAEPGRYAPRRAAGALSPRRRCPRSRRSTCAAHPPERGGFLSPLLVAAVRRDAGARRAGAALPQPPRLCAADALPRLRPPLPVPELLEPGWSSTAFAASSSATIAATPSARPEACPNCGDARPSGRLRPGRRAPRRGGASRTFPRRARSCCRATCSAASKRLRLELEAIAKGEADIVIGTQLVAKGHNFPQPDAGRRGRRRSRPRQRRPARGRAHLPAPQPGDRAAPGARARRAAACSRPTRPTIR